MYLLTSTVFNGGDVLFRLIAFIMLLAIPLIVILLLFLVLKKNRLKRIEGKLDKLLSDKEIKDS